MKKFVFKFWLLVFVMVIGVFIGMQKANDGMLQMKGYEDQLLQSPVHLSENEDGTIDAALLGNELTVDQLDLTEKKKELEELETFNFFSSLGKTLTNIVTAIMNKFVQFIMNFF